MSSENNEQKPEEGEQNICLQEPSKEAQDRKNFRSSYYTKMGFRGVEERKSIESFLNPVDVQKIKLFLQNYALPEVHRGRVWKLLLGIELPAGQPNIHAIHLKRINCHELEKSIRFLCPDKEEMDLSEKIAYMLVVERGDLKTPLIEQLGSRETQQFALIAKCFFSICSLPFEDTFYMVRNFVQIIKQQRPNFPIIQEEVYNHLNREDPVLEKTLRLCDVDKPLYSLWEKAYAGQLDQNVLTKVWDKVLGGNFRHVMARVTATHLMILRNHLLDHPRGFTDLTKLPEPLSPEKNDLILDYI